MRGGVALGCQRGPAKNGVKSATASPAGGVGCGGVCGGPARAGQRRHAAAGFGLAWGHAPGASL